MMEYMLRKNSSQDPSDNEAPGTLESRSASHHSPPAPGPRQLPMLNGFMLHTQHVSERLKRMQREDCTKSLERTILSPLTADPAEISLVEQCLDDVCAELPFVQSSWFLDQLRRPDATHLPEAWWQGIMNAIIASAVCFRTINSAIREVAVYSWAFFRNAYAVLPELIIQADNLGGAQAVMAMAMFMRQSADTRTTALLLSIAIRMQNSAGLYTNTATESNPPAVEMDNYSRLFWAGVILDMDMAVTTGLPAGHVNQVLTVDLPGLDRLHCESPLTPNRIMGGNRNETVFKARAELALLLSRIGTLLPNPSLADLSALESELEAWRLRVPVEIRPVWHSQPASDNRVEAAELVVVMLHLRYYNGLCMLCWASIRHARAETLESHQTRDPSRDWTSSHESLAKATARAAIRSITQLPTPSFTQLW